MSDYENGSMNPEVMCRIAEENGIQTLDILEWEISLYGEKELRQAMEAHGICCGCLIVSLPFFVTKNGFGEKLEAGLKAAERLQTKYLMVIPGDGSDQEAEICAGYTKQQLLDIAVEKFNVCTQAAKVHDITVLFEDTPHWYKPLSAPEDCLYVLKHVPGLRFVFDTGNFKVADTAADERAAYECLKPYISRIHLKDVVVGPFADGERCIDGNRIRPVVTGSGVVPMAQLIKQFAADGFSDKLVIEYNASAEYHGMEHSENLSVYCSFIQRTLKESPVWLQYIRINGLKLPVSRILFGTAIRPMVSGRDAFALLDGMVSVGINTFDCARGYGFAEKSLGNWVKARNNRDRINILTKCGNIKDGAVCINRRVIEEELAESLKTLQTEYIDIFLLHRDDPGTSVGEYIETLNDVKRQGKILAFGVSNWSYQRIEEANKYAHEHGLEGFTISSPNYGLAVQYQDPWGGNCITLTGKSNEMAREWYARTGMPVFAYSSMARGFFSGKFRSGDYEGAKAVLDEAGQHGYLCKENMERLRRAEKLAERDNCSVAMVAMRYIFSSNMNIFAISSSASPLRMQQNVIASNWPLSKEDTAWLELGDGH